jgi:alkaline phosphatase
MNTMKILSPVVMAAMLAACSDGGDSSARSSTAVDAEAPPSPPPVEPELVLGADGVDMTVANGWFQRGKAEIVESAAVVMNNSPGAARNVILFVGDGMGVSTVTAGRIFAGQLAGESGEDYQLSFEQLPYSGLSKTYNTNLQTPDSAGTATAMLAGVKTLAGVVGVNDKTVRHDCDTIKGNEVVSALMLAEEAGKSTGVVTTTGITHATPAASYAHSADRDWEYDSAMPAEALAAGCSDIAAQLIEFPYGDGIDVAMGGGRTGFIPNTATDPESGRAGGRSDGRNLVDEWQAKHPSGAYVWNQQQFDLVDAGSTDKLFGLFNPSHMEFEQDRADDTGGEPSLAEMTAKALGVLQNNSEGFFLLVEAGRIDHGHHFGVASAALADTKALSDAVQVALDATDASDTLIIVTADHSHTLTMGGYPTLGNPILGQVVTNDSAGESEASPTLAMDDLPYTTLSYRNGLKAGRQDLSMVDTEDPHYRQEALVSTLPETHAAEDVGIYASGPGSHLLTGTVEQNIIFHVMDYAAGLTGGN